MDCFAGSGTTLGAAFELGRQWIGVDCGKKVLKQLLSVLLKDLNHMVIMFQEILMFSVRWIYFLSVLLKYGETKQQKT